MELKQFIKQVLQDTVEAVEEVRKTSVRDMHLSSHKESSQTVEFDIAVSASEKDVKSGKTGIKVLQFAEAGGELSKEVSNSTVSRVKFGVHINSMTRDEITKQQADIRAHNIMQSNNYR